MSINNGKMDQIINLIKMHAKESWEGNYQKANKHIKSYTKMICELIDESNTEILSILIEDEASEVQSVGAYFLLPIDSKFAEKKLKSLLGKKRME